MENVIKKPYELSLWDDDLTFKVFAAQQVSFNDVLKYEKDKYYYLNNFQGQGSGATNQFIIDGAKQPTSGRTYYTYGELLDEQVGSFVDKDYGTRVIIVQYYKERKICIIGSDTMATPIRAVQPKLVSNINGSNTLTFTIYSRYYDQDSETFYDNPFLGMLVNERKVKLRYGAPEAKDTKWYDFVIKDVKENSSTKAFTYICKDLFINELSKSGFNLQLDAELENNLGNINYLADVILDESDWKRGDNNDIITQTREEPLYAVTIGNITAPLVAKNMEDSNDVISLQNGDVVYVFYSILTNKEPYFQFLYRADSKYETDSDHVITNSPNYFIDGVEYLNELPSFVATSSFSSEFRGDRLVRQPITEFDSTVDKYVQVYEKQGQQDVKYYGYTKTDYITPTSVENFITNPESFSSTTGWKAGGIDVSGETQYPELQVYGYPDMRDMNEEQISNNENFYSYLRMKTLKSGQNFFNSGFSDFRSSIKSLAKNDKFVIRAKFYEANLNSEGRVSSIKNTTKTIAFTIGSYTLSNGVYDIDEVYFSGNLKMSGEWASTTITSKVSKSYTDLINSRLGIFLSMGAGTDIFLEKIQWYRYIEYDRLKDGSETEYETVVAEPGGELFSAARTKYIYYLPNSEYKSEDDIVPVYENYTEDPTFIKKYNDNQFEKVRSITASESNRFNMIQDLCETFECWAKFEIEHNLQTGEIELDENYRQKKWITFHEYIGQDNHAGFRYGVNLKSIQRTLNSDGIVSKIIVKDNANEFAPNGFCSIARAPENPTGENFIYNFNYYIQQGLVDFDEINNDLYLEINGYLGYYKKLKRINAERETKIDEQSKLVNDISKYESNYKAYRVSVEASEEELLETEQAIMTKTGFTPIQLKRIYDKKKQNKTLTEEEEKGYKWWSNDGLVAQMTKVTHLKSVINSHSKLRDDYGKTDADGNLIGGKLYVAEQRYAELEEYIKELATKKRALNLQFYKKYSRFIQEGSWISEDYVDENLYYLDAESTLYTSAQPKVTYTIEVLELSQLEDYKNYSFKLGDKTYIEDTEFFGWKWSESGIKTPYHEEIVVSEISIELDSPEKNTIKVQNFKTQFEDLFQRMAATTQSVEYHTGEYGRVVNVVETNGTIAAETLENSIANNAIRLENAKDQSVVWDETGITTTSLTKPNEIVRIVSGGIFMSDDGGSSWRTGITGQGINASYLTSGQINTSIITIKSGKFDSFRWDDKGLEAYEFSVSDDGRPYGFNPNKYVRYDQYGLYGIQGISDFDPTKVDDNTGKVGVDKIWDNASFALTWNGFILKAKHGDGYTSITSEDDIVVNDGTYNRIKIGNLGSTSAPLYGIKIADGLGVAVMETHDDGTLWLENCLYIGQKKNNTWISTVGIGILEGSREVNNQTYQEVFHAGTGNVEGEEKPKEFIVYEDGYMVASGGEFHGAIYADGGKIGNMTIGEVEGAIGNIGNLIDQTKKLDIESKLGYNFKVGANNSVTPAGGLNLEAVATGFELDESKLTWFGSNDFTNWEKRGTGSNYLLTYNNLIDLGEKGPIYDAYYIQLQYGENEYVAYCTINIIRDGNDGPEGDTPVMLIVENTQGSIFINGDVNTTLIARAYQNNLEVTSNFTKDQFSWTKYDKNGDIDVDWSNAHKGWGNTLEVDGSIINKKAKFVCDLQF